MRIAFVNHYEKNVVRDMQGGFGFVVGDQIRLPPLELIQYATIAAAEHDVEVLDFQFEHQRESFVADAYDLIMGTVSAPCYHGDRKFFAGQGQRQPVLVHTHLTDALAPTLREDFSACGILMGEGENLLLDVLRNCNGRPHGKVWQPGKRVDVQTLPVADRGLLKNKNYYYMLLPETPTVTVQTSRGCPHLCRYYCTYPLSQGQQFRAMKPQRMFDEVKHCIECGYKSIFFRDAVFTHDLKRVRKFCELILKHDLKFQWFCETRIGSFDKDFVTLIKAAGCYGVLIGVESGNIAVRDKIGKKYSAKKLLSAANLMRNARIAIHAQCMVGLPGENEVKVKDTAQFLRELRPNTLGVTIATPYAGTEFHKEATEERWIKGSVVDALGGYETTVNYPDFSREKIIAARDYLYNYMNH